MAARFRVGLVADLLDAAGKPTFGAEPLAILDEAPAIKRVWLPERHREIPPALALEYDALYLTQSRVTRASVARAAEGRLKVIARGINSSTLTSLHLAKKFRLAFGCGQRPR
jgi:hypothetical protein